jgi:hypothetical protein
MRAFAVFLCFFCISSVFAETQEALFERALDAESEGDVPKTIALLEEASTYEGPYRGEIEAILKEYYAALQITDEGQSEFSGNFLAKVEGSGFTYEEYGNSANVNENSGDSYALLGGEFDYHTSSGWTHFWFVSLSADVFFREKETVFDTSRWAFTPSLEYNLQGDWFVFGASVDFGVSERDGLLPAGTLFAERDVFQNKDYRAGIYAFGYANVNGRARVQTDFYWNYRPSLGFWYNVSIGARLERDTIVNSYLPQENVTLEPQTTPLRFYAGRPTKLGPELRLQTGYKFSKVWSVDLRSTLYYGLGLNEDSWLAPNDYQEFSEELDYNTYQRKMLQGYWMLRGEWKGDVLGAYLSLGQHFIRYEDLPADHPEILFTTSILSEVRLGFSARF